MGRPKMFTHSEKIFNYTFILFKMRGNILKTKIYIDF